VARVWLLGVAGWAFACSALLAAFSSFDRVWALLLVAGAGVTVAWLCAAAVLSLRRRWNRRSLLLWGAWPVAVGGVALLHATDLPMTVRVIVSDSALTQFAQGVRESGRTRGRAGLVWVFDARTRDGCIFLEAGSTFDGIAGLIHAPGATEPPSHPGWALTETRHLTGAWWYFQTRT
jgi:hypothetical protein